MELEPLELVRDPLAELEESIHDVTTYARFLEGGVAQQTDILPASVTSTAGTIAEGLKAAAERLMRVRAALLARPPRPSSAAPLTMPDGVKPLKRSKPSKPARATAAPPVVRPAAAAGAALAANGAAPGPTTAP